MQLFRNLPGLKARFKARLQVLTTLMLTSLAAGMIFWLPPQLAVAQEREAIRLENYLKQQIEAYLSQVISSKAFLVTTSVQVSKERTQEVEEEVVDTFSKEDSKAPVYPPPAAPAATTQPTAPTPAAEEELLLPGLENLVEEATTPPAAPPPPPTPSRTDLEAEEVPFETRSSEQRQSTSKKFNYNETITVEEVGVRIVLDETLPEELTTTIRQVIAEKLSTTYGERALVTFLTARLPYSREQSSPSTEESETSSSGEPPKSFLDYLREYSFLLYLLLALVVLGLLFLLTVFLISLTFRYLNRKEETQRARELRAEAREVANLKKLEEEEKNKAQIPPPLNYYDPRFAAVPPPPPSANPKEDEKPKYEAPAPQVKADEEVAEATVVKAPSVVKPEEIPDYTLAENMFISNFLKTPLVARKYFQSLGEQEKSDLVYAFSNESIKGMFESLSEKPLPRSDNLDNLKELDAAQEKIRIFNKHLKGLEQYYTMLKPQVEDSLGKLSLLTEKELNYMLSTVEPETLADLSRIVDSKLLIPYFRSLEEKRKRELMKALNQEKELTLEETENLEKRFQNKINDLMKRIFINKSNKQIIMENLIESSENTKGLLEEIREINEEFFQKNQRYLINFEDFLQAATSDEFRRAVNEAENDTLAAALLGLSSQSQTQVLTALPENRRNLLLSLIPTKRGVLTQEEIKTEQKKLLELFRSLSQPV